jgi:hypothetical protein
MNGTNCLGKLSLEIGHKRVPEPPQRMTGRILKDIVVFYMRPPKSFITFGGISKINMRLLRVPGKYQLDPL